MTTPKPPPHLSLAAQQWWRAVARTYVLEPRYLAILTKAAEAYDRAETARLVIEREGLTYLDRFGSPRPRPEVAIERDGRIGFYRGLRELDLDGTGSAVSDVPRIAGRT